MLSRRITTHLVKVTLVKYPIITLITGLLMTSVVSTTQAAEKRYLTDTLFVTLRAEPSTSSESLAVLQTGEVMTLIGERNGFSQVRTSTGLEGYMSSKYLDENPNAKVLLEKKETEMEALQEEFVALAAERDELRAALEAKQEGAVDGTLPPVLLDENTRKLSLRNQELEIQLETLNAETAQLRNNNSHVQLIYGGILVVFGLIFGLLLPNLRSRRRNSGWA